MGLEESAPDDTALELGDHPIVARVAEPPCLPTARRRRGYPGVA